MAKNGYATKADIGDVKSVLKDLKSKILESEVKILGELKDMREEFDVHQFSHVRINDELPEHDQRLKSLESPKI